MLPSRLTTGNARKSYNPGMVTRIRSKRKLHLYIAEWREDRGLTQEELGNRIELPDEHGMMKQGVERNTVSRWETDQQRLNPYKIAAIAKALDLEPQELWRPPVSGQARPSLDKIMEGQPQDAWDTAADIVSRLIRKAS